jgi:hypothetical protein
MGCLACAVDWDVMEATGNGVNSFRYEARVNRTGRNRDRWL